MAKILLVEDDISLREIYAARLQAEGYEVGLASDGEEALATAVKMKPDLIVLDVMMPKISGFDVLDILRSTLETKHAKIIMMTALSQQSDRERGERLGADLYLVKSQVTLEDVVNNVKDLLSKAESAAADVVAKNVQPVVASPATSAKTKTTDTTADDTPADDAGSPADEPAATALPEPPAIPAAPLEDSTPAAPTEPAQTVSPVSADDIPPAPAGILPVDDTPDEEVAPVAPDIINQDSEVPTPASPPPETPASFTDENSPSNPNPQPGETIMPESAPQPE